MWPSVIPISDKQTQGIVYSFRFMCVWEELCLINEMKLENYLSVVDQNSYVFPFPKIKY